MHFRIQKQHPLRHVCEGGAKNDNPFVISVCEGLNLMAVNSENQATQAFPNPPAVYYKLYTDENVQSGRAPPPPPPVKGPYHMFGAPFDVSKTCVAGSRAPIGQQTNDVMVRPLGEQRLTQVYPNQSGENFEDGPALALMNALKIFLFFSPTIAL